MHIKRSLNLSSISNSPRTLLPIIITAILLVTSLASAALLQNSPSAHALTPPDSCFAFNADTGTITNYYNNEGNNPANPACPKAVDIPSTIGGVPVTAIAAAANNWNPATATSFANKSLTSLTIPSSVTSIGNFAFIYNQLTSVTIPSSVTTIGSGAFSWNRLTNVTIPSSVTSIGYSAFSDNQLTSLTIPSSVTSISNSAFYNNQLTSLSIPSSVTSIGYRSFYGNELTGVTIPNSVTSIEDEAFGVNQLTSVTIPSSVTSIKDGVFRNNQLASVTIPSSVMIIGDSAFSFNQLTSITIPDSVTSIGNYAFSDNQLTNLSIPNSVTSIGDSAFSDNQLTNLSIPSSVTSIGDYAFRNNQLTNLNISNPTTSMQHSSFENNPTTSMTIGSITYIQQNPTTDSACFSMTGSTITDYYSNSPLIARDNGVICGRDVTIPNSVTSIGEWAFSDNQLTNLSIPSSVTSIGNYAFYGNQLTNLSIPNSVTSIDDYAFSDNQLTSLTIPSSVTSIGQSAFSNNQLTSLTIPSSVTSIGQRAFSDNQLTSLTIPSSVTSIGYSAFSNNQLTSLTIPSSVTSIGSYAFSDNQLTSLTIVGDTATIGYDAFTTDNLQSISYDGRSYSRDLPLPEGCWHFDSGVLSGVDDSISFASLQDGDAPCLVNRDSFNIPEVIGGEIVVVIDGDAFEDLNLTNVTIPSSVTSIGDRAFRNNQLTSLTIPSGVTSIGNSAFQANAIREVIIPNSVTSIDEQAFALQTPQGRAYDRFGLGGDPASVAIANQTVSEFFYTRLYTESPTNPNNLQSEVIFYETELDGDGNWDDPVVVGGHIVNPASAETHHVNQSNASLHEAQTFTGQLPDNSYLHDYNVSKGPAIPMPADAWSPTSEEQTAAVQALSAYYRLGNQLALTPPTISGYLTPQPHNLTLSQVTTNHTFTYKPIITEVPFKDNQSVDEGEVIANTTPPPSIAHPIITNSKLSLPTDSTCQTISNAKLMSPTTLQDSENSNSNNNNQTNNIPSDITLLGGLDFTLDHCQAGSATDIAYTLGQEIDDTTSLRVYKHNPAQTNPNLQIQDITNLVNFNTSQDGYTTITYSLTDGGELDQDGQVNGTIVDPIYIGMLASASGEPDGGGEVVGEATTGSGSSSVVTSNDKELASTGNNLLVGLIASSGFIVAGGWMLDRRFKTKP